MFKPNQFFWQKINKMQHFFFAYGLFCCKLLFLEIVSLKAFFFNSKSCYYIYAYWLQFEEFFEIMSLVKSKFT